MNIYKPSESNRRQTVDIYNARYLAQVRRIVHHCADGVRSAAGALVMDSSAVGISDITCGYIAGTSFGAKNISRTRKEMST